MLAFMQDSETQLVQDLSAQNSLTHTYLPQLLIVGGALFAVILVAVGWAAFVRKKPRRRRIRHHWRTQTAVSINGDGQASESRRRRRSRSSERPRNPTLAETRGLPPVRDEEPKPPPSY